MGDRVKSALKGEREARRRRRTTARSEYVSTAKKETATLDFEGESSAFANNLLFIGKGLRISADQVPSLLEMVLCGIGGAGFAVTLPNDFRDMG